MCIDVEAESVAVSGFMLYIRRVIIILDRYTTYYIKVTSYSLSLSVCLFNDAGALKS